METDLGCEIIALIIAAIIQLWIIIYILTTLGHIRGHLGRIERVLKHWETERLGPADEYYSKIYGGEWVGTITGIEDPEESFQVTLQMRYQGKDDKGLVNIEYRLNLESPELDHITTGVLIGGPDGLVHFPLDFGWGDDKLRCRIKGEQLTGVLGVSGLSKKSKKYSITMERKG